MNAAIALLTLVVCALSCHWANAREHSKCQLEVRDIKKGINKMYDEGRIPECAKELEMDRFKCTAGEDEEVDRQKREEFKNWFQEQDDDTKLKTLDCFEDMGRTALKEAGDTLSEECEEKWQKIRRKMLGKKN